MIEQVAVNAAVSASAVVLAGISFYLPFSVARFFHFTHGAAYVLAAYTFFFLTTQVNAALGVALLLGVAAASLFGLALDWLIYRPMRRIHAGGFALLLASLGAYILVQNIVSMFFGDAAVSISAIRHWGVHGFALVRITHVQAVQVTVAALTLIVLWAALTRTATGLSMRAVGQDANLSRCVGIRAEGITSLAFGIGYGLAGLAGIIMALDVDAVPTMGMRPMMLGMVAMIIGGNTVVGVVCSAILLGVALHFGVLWLPTQWQDAIAFVILILFLLLRPGGVAGKPVKTVSV
jgi:branched-subunit amino acid ABC-type transport system permease component